MRDKPDDFFGGGGQEGRCIFDGVRESHGFITDREAGLDAESVDDFGISMDAAGQGDDGNIEFPGGGGDV